MRLSNRFRFVTGFLAKGSRQRLARKGTYFAVQRGWAGWMNTPPDESIRYMVTARHVVETHGDLIAVAFAKDSLNALVWSVSGDSWLFPQADGLDLAMRPFDPPSNGLEVIALPTGLDVDDISEHTELGQPVHLTGLLAWEHPRMPWTPRPVVRSGSVAALGETGIVWGDSLEWTSREVHLIDVRSRSGFSGSPCFVQFLLSDPTRGPVPPIWERMASFAGNDITAMGSIRTVTHWFGVLVGYADDAGIGIVVPAALVRETLRAVTNDQDW